jgi:hypothetical protein
MVFRWRIDFGLSAQKAPQLVTVALAVLRDLVRPPDGMIAIEVGDGQRLFAPASSNAAALRLRLSAARLP